MYKIGTYTVTERQIQRWTRNFVPERAPYFFTNTTWLDYFLKQGILVYTKKEFFDMFTEFAVSYGFIYKVWTVPENAHVIFVHSHELSPLTEPLREDILRAQVQLNRGQVYDPQWIMQMEGAAKRFQSRKLCPILVDGKESIVLTHAVWSGLPENVKTNWLLRWLSEQVNPQGESVQLPPETPLPIRSREIVSHYASTFPDISGPNCFAATIAAAVGNPDMASTIIRQWLHAGPFFRLLAAHGYEKMRQLCLSDAGTAIQPHDVLVWETRDNDPIHAAYAVSDKLVFNKWGQFWHQPWQIVPLKEVFDYNDALSEGGRISVYRQKGLAP